MKIFICANDEQGIAAKVSRTLLLQQNYIPPQDIQIIYEKDCFDLTNFFGKKFLRAGKWETFEKDDLQRFTLLRFLIPEIMNYNGLALVIDPDIFMIKDKIKELFNNINDYAILCRQGTSINSYASSLMLLNCSLLKDWKLTNFLGQLTKGSLDYDDLINLRFCRNIGLLENCWNDFDCMDDQTIFLHTTQKITQPWRKGLNLNSYIPPLFGFIKRDLIYRVLKKPLRIGVEHPIEEINQFFFASLTKAIRIGEVSKHDIDSAINSGFLRTDIYSKIENII